MANICYFPLLLFTLLPVTITTISLIELKVNSLESSKQHHGQFKSAANGFKWKNDGNVRWAYGCGYYRYGDYLRSIASSSIRECGKKCSKTSECSHFTWINAYCYMRTGGLGNLEDAAKKLQDGVCGYVTKSLEWRDTADNLFRLAQNCDFPDWDSSSGVASTSVHECGTKWCVQTSACTRFTWSNGRCYPKAGGHGKEGEATARPGYVCGYVKGRIWYDTDDNFVRWTYNCDFPGRDLSDVESTSRECGGKCVQSSTCTRFSWYNDRCYLKSGGHVKEGVQGDAKTRLFGVCGYVKGRN